MTKYKLDSKAFILKTPGEKEKLPSLDSLLSLLRLGGTSPWHLTAYPCDGGYRIR